MLGLLALSVNYLINYVICRTYSLSLHLFNGYIYSINALLAVMIMR
ncbi:Uncharacterized protein YR821_1716 [Yersinia ruckeri]|uniref:Uncharacterized protein n=1 Tax=Yersinia ruckeri TaxID=29486 RepID=A0A0A8VGM5_YERRU|nr:hypothetical protein yruck0001_14720 [Yersinia ruckeri ATCC 29473]QTD76640.1 Uncharacterized protein YR821_1716 [Yersinia ruckeri]CEK27538.1 hypothetical protein CSF007_8925 [Yersinia ruckeri]